ncbi:MAG: hypothetical protein U1A28_01300 [Patescibacteria group bacterium]|nr:hypothetical protein [Patescibacteria group bacterium]
MDKPKNRQKSHRGFLLIETLVYLSVLLAISLVIVGTFLSQRSVFGQARAHHILTQAAESSLERMVFEIENAVQVDVAGSVFGSHPGSLTVSTDAGTRAFYLDGSQLRVREDGVDAGPLTPPSASVQELIFTHYQNAHTEAVRISLRLHIEDRFASTTETFTTMTLLRNSYE